MNKTYVIELDSLDVGQLLDGLRCREESWRNTAIYFRHGVAPDDNFICEECSDADEAESIADHYRSIIAKIKKQQEEQS